jgi:hypothetical protein
VKVFVFAYNRYDTMTTSTMLEDEGIDHTVMCHSEDDALMFIAGRTAKASNMYVTNNPKGLAYQRNSALDLMDEGEWAVFLVDDLINITELRNYATATDPLPITTVNQGVYRERFKYPVTMRHFINVRAPELIAKCEHEGARLGGWAGNDNTMFRKGHWGKNILADGRAWVVRKTHLRFDSKVQMIDDVCWTAQNIEAFGSVIVDRWVLPLCKRFTKGAFGSKQERMPQKIAEAAYLVATYPNLITFKAKAGWPTGSHVALRTRPNPHSDPK